MKWPIGCSQGDACWITRFHNKHLNLFLSCAFNAKSGNDKRRIIITVQIHNDGLRRLLETGAQSLRNIDNLCLLNSSAVTTFADAIWKSRKRCCSGVGHRGSIKTITTFLSKGRARPATKQGKWEFFSKGSSEGEEKGTYPPRPGNLRETQLFMMTFNVAFIHINLSVPFMSRK